MTRDKKSLSSMKHTLYEMLNLSGKSEEPDYEVLIDNLNDLNFKQFTVENYISELREVVDSMIDLDDLGFDMGQLYHFQTTLN